MKEMSTAWSFSEDVFMKMIRYESVFFVFYFLLADITINHDLNSLK